MPPPPPMRPPTTGSDGPSARSRHPGMGADRTSSLSRRTPIGGTYYPHFHAGIDFANGCGTPIYSVGAGVVVASGQPLRPWDSGYRGRRRPWERDPDVVLAHAAASGRGARNDRDQRIGHRLRGINRQLDRMPRALRRQPQRRLGEPSELPALAGGIGSGADRAADRGQVQPVHVLGQHPGGAELPQGTLDGRAHHGQPIDRQPIGVASEELRNDLVLQQPVELAGVGSVLGGLVTDRLTAADGPPVLTVEALVPPTVQDREGRDPVDRRLHARGARRLHADGAGC